VTGAVDQHGRVQTVGGVTTKVEGFLAVCRAGGLTGEQGVAIPRANVPHLMLSDEVVAAIARG
jgi:predicted ATP-dependent protease